MKKVININFQGQVIAIEEDAYEILKQYIDSLQSYFSREEGGDEIVNDIECRIAELFGNRLKHGIPCITDEDVETIIASIGRPSDFDTDYEEPAVVGPDVAPGSQQSGTGTGKATGTEPPRRLFRNSSDQIIGGVASGLAHYFKVDPVWVRLLFVLFFGLLFWVYIILWIVLKSKPLESNVTKRFYRNPGDRVLGGVCGGLAAYFKIDSWIPRVLFLLPLVFNVMGMVSFFPLNRLFDHLDFNWNVNMSLVVVYIVLWIIIPEAKTVKQKLEMMGEEEYIQSIRDRVNDNVSGTKARAEGGFTESSTSEDPSAPHDPVTVTGNPTDEMPPEPPQTVSYATPPPAREARVAPSTEPARSGCLNGIVLLLKIVFFTFVGILGLTLLSIFIGFLFTGAHLMPLKSLFIDPGYETQLLLISLFLLILVPVLSIVTWIVRRLMKAKSRPLIGVIAMVLWIGGIVTTGMLATRIANKYNVESSSEISVPITPVTADKLYVEMLPYHDDYAEFKSPLRYGPYANFDLPFTTIDEDSLLFNEVNLHIRNSSDSLFHVRTIAASRGYSLKAAKADIARFSYTIQQNDSILFLPEFLSVPLDQGYRNQSITIEIAVPAGKSVEVSDELSAYRNNNPPSVVRRRIKSK